MSACTEHVQYQLPNKRSHIGFLVHSIHSADAGLQAAMACVKMDNGLNGLQNNIERAVSHLLPYDPVATKSATGIKRVSAMISLGEAEIGPITTIAATNLKPSIGKTGVHLRYHIHHEYRKLTQEKRCELSKWRLKNPDSHKPSYVKKPYVPSRSTKSKQITTLVSQQVAAKMQKYNRSTHVHNMNTMDKTPADQEQHLMSMVQSAVAKHFATPPSPPRPLPPIRKPQPIEYALPSNWGEVVDRLYRRMNTST